MPAICLPRCHGIHILVVVDVNVEPTQRDLDHSVGATQQARECCLWFVPVCCHSRPHGHHVCQLITRWCRGSGSYRAEQFQVTLHALDNHLRARFQESCRQQQRLSRGLALQIEAVATEDNQHAPVACDFNILLKLWEPLNCRRVVLSHERQSHRSWPYALDDLENLSPPSRQEGAKDLISGLRAWVVILLHVILERDGQQCRRTLSNLRTASVLGIRLDQRCNGCEACIVPQDQLVLESLTIIRIKPEALAGCPFTQIVFLNLLRESEELATLVQFLCSLQCLFTVVCSLSTLQHAEALLEQAH
mmetsp:Transcript_89637/g.208796  ORF Transcript_89637/g.208796 Transcript_89637/m.208796 type:complete len:305 (-) Transcript_89637:464-1378(-)